MSKLKPCPFCGSRAELRGGKGVASWIICNNPECRATQGLELSGENAVAEWNTRIADDAKDKEIERLKVHCNALHDCLFVLQKMHEELMGNDELSEDAKDVQLEVVTNIVKVLATARFHGIKGTICPNCESQDCSNCDIDTIMAIQERIANAPDSTKGGEV